MSMTLDECRANIGKEVVYHPLWLDCEAVPGVITSVSSTYAFVRYPPNVHSKATHPSRLTLLEDE